MLATITSLSSCNSNNIYSDPYATGPVQALLGVYILFCIILIFFAIALPSITAAIIASKEGRSVGGWIVCSLFIGWLAVFILALLMNCKPSITTRSIRIREKEFEKYKCVRCNELISTKRCGYCGFENDTRNLKKKVSGLASLVPESSTGNWTCKCGTVNNYHNYDCPNCLSPRPKK